MERKTIFGNMPHLKTPEMILGKIRKPTMKKM